MTPGLLIMHNEFIKASNALHCAHTMSLIQAKLWDFILAHTPPKDILTKKEHQLPLSVLLKFLDTGNAQHIQKSLEEMSSMVTRPIINKESREWGEFTFFATAYVTQRIFYYSYPDSIKEYLARPTVYSRIKLSEISAFDSKYSLFLYYLCFDYLDVRQTPWISLETLYTYMGITQASYPDFSSLNCHVIKKAVNEVNEKSGIIVRFSRQRKGSKVVAVKFMVASELEKSYE